MVIDELIGKAIGMTLELTRRSLKRKKWPNVEGVLESYELKKSWPYVKVIAIISYDIDGEKYTITDEGEVASEEIAENYIQLRYIERDIEISYNPKNPQEAIITSVEIT